MKRLVKPDRQLELTEDERKEEIQRVLTGDDPNVPRNVCKYSYKDRCFKLDPPGQSDHMAVHFSSEGSSLHIDSKEYQSQKRREDKKREAEADPRKQNDAVDKKSGDGSGDVKHDNGEEGVAAGTTTGVEVAAATSSTCSDDGKNQFNFSERATQTFNNPTRSREVNTEPPPVTQYSANVSQWQIYDSYMSDALIGRMGSNEGKGGGGSETRGGMRFEDRLSVILEDDGSKGSKDPMHGENMARLLKITERLVNQNSGDEIFQDFKYWEDLSDEYRQGEGSLLPLWRFSTEQTKRKQATSVCWNPRYSDLFAVSYGSFDFSKQASGLICLFSLKNTSYPEYIFRTEAGVMCLDFHPQHPSLLAVGCYDGSVMVYDVSSGKTTPIYSSSVRTGKHTDPVWQVHWQCEDYGKECTFYSVSSDGRVAKWHMCKNELKMEPVMTLKLTAPPASAAVAGAAVTSSKDSYTSNDGDDDAYSAAVLPEEVIAVAASSTLSGLASGCCFDFNQTQDHLFVVGTEEGSIHKCSKAYSGQYLETYVGHHMAVYAVKWNPFHERIFITCSADWTVKLWDHDISHPIMSFDLGNSIGDICWSPYSSTVFGCVTSDGKVHVFDLAENKNEALCQQKITKKGRLTNVKFNSKDYILIVGDDRGVAHTLKLSPNLRKCRNPPEDKDVGFEEWQRARMETLLSAHAGK